MKLAQHIGRMRKIQTEIKIKTFSKKARTVKVKIRISTP